MNDIERAALAEIAQRDHAWKPKAGRASNASQAARDRSWLLQLLSKTQQADGSPLTIEVGSATLKKLVEEGRLSADAAALVLRKLEIQLHRVEALERPAKQERARVEALWADLIAKKQQEAGGKSDE